MKISFDDEELLRLASRLRLTFTRLVRQLRRADAGLSPTLHSALATVEGHGPLNLGDLAAHEHVRPPTMTRIVAKLAADGLVTRTTDPLDRRAGVVALSSKGRRLLERSRSRRNAYLARRLGGLSPEELATLANAGEILDRLMTAGDATPARAAAMTR